MKNIYEKFSEELCSNCKNKYKCTEELRQRLDGTLCCELYERVTKQEGYKDQIKMTITANRNKPIMKGIDK